jgi:hypothetical protein
MQEHLPWLQSRVPGAHSCVQKIPLHMGACDLATQDLAWQQDAGTHSSSAVQALTFVSSTCLAIDELLSALIESFF